MNFIIQFYTDAPSPFVAFIYFSQQMIKGKPNIFIKKFINLLD